MRPNALIIVAGLACAAIAQAQTGDTLARTPQDSALARARQLALQGRDAEGRKVVDSLLAGITPEHEAYAEALFVRGSLAPTAADAERDYRRLLIEAPLSARAEDALLQLAQLEQARGDRRGASDHLQRYLLSYPNGSARARASVQLVRLLFDQGPQQLARACDALRTAKSDVPSANVELRNQLEAHVPRCAYVEAETAQAIADSLAAAAAAAAATAAAPPTDTTRPAIPPLTPTPAPTSGVLSPTTTPPVTAQVASPALPTAAAPSGANVTQTTPAAVAPTAPATAPFYSVQVAAYDSQEAATRLVQQLVARGVDARIDGDKAPYRVRVGKYQTRAAAAKASADLKGKGHNGFITLVSPSAK